MDAPVSRPLRFSHAPPQLVPIRSSPRESSRYKVRDMHGGVLESQRYSLVHPIADPLLGELHRLPAIFDRNPLVV
jgi:hypothetical protein